MGRQSQVPNLGPSCCVLRPSLVALVELAVLAVDSVGLGWRLRICTAALRMTAPVARLSDPVVEDEPPVLDAPVAV